MDRRNFFKIATTVSAGVASTACSNKGTDQLIPLLVSEREIVPGFEQWHPSVCGECAAGCGTIVRVMEGQRTTERNGQKVRERIATIKKIEGNPVDPVSGGRLCARGQASVQALYHPDRLQGPQKRTGSRGTGQFAAVSWNEATASVAEQLGKIRSADPGKILFLTGSPRGSRTETISRFLTAMGAPAALSCSLTDLALEQRAAQQVLGWAGVPVYDIARARYVLGIGADFLGTWASPVYYARQYGAFRQGRPGVRGKFVQAESRMSTTASNADEWLPLRPGTEAQFTVALGRIILDDKLARNEKGLPSGVADSLRAADVTGLLRTCGLEEKRVRRIAHELASSEAPLVIGGASAVHTNSLLAIAATHYLNLLLGAVGQTGGVLAPASAPMGGEAGNRKLADALSQAQVILLEGANPIYTLPAAAGAKQALEKAALVVSFGPFVDDSAAYADMLLPDHHSLESATAVLPVVSPRGGLALATPFVQPLYNTRSVEETLANVASKMNVTFEAATAKSMAAPLLPSDVTFEAAARQGGYWPEAATEQKGAEAPRPEALQVADAAFSGAPDQFPLLFQPYLSQQFEDGRGANLPWLQEVPDAASSAMWGLPVEIDPQTAIKFQVNDGDILKIESPHGSLEAPAYVNPAAIPGVVSMPIGQGHTHYGRYASGIGANPLSIVAPVFEAVTGALAFGGTRVRISKGEQTSAKLIQFAVQDREEGRFGYR